MKTVQNIVDTVKLLNPSILLDAQLISWLNDVEGDVHYTIKRPILKSSSVLLKDVTTISMPVGCEGFRLLTVNINDRPWKELKPEENLFKNNGSWQELGTDIMINPPLFETGKIEFIYIEAFKAIQTLEVSRDLIVIEPYSIMYQHYLLAMECLALKEISSYSNYMALYNAVLDAYKDFMSGIVKNRPTKFKNMWG